MAKAEQLQKAVGITAHTNLGNKQTIRFGADFIGTVKRFQKNATRCDYIELPEEMTKLAALQFMLKHADFQSPVDQALIDEKMHKYLVKPAKSEKSVKGSKTSVAKTKKVTAQDVLAAVTE
jgi:hypothetical protein